MEPECRAPIMQHEHNVAVETEIADMRNDVSPKIRPGRVAMEKYNRFPLSRLDEADLGPRNVHPPARVRVARTNCHCHYLDLHSAAALHDHIGSRAPCENSLTLLNG